MSEYSISHTRPALHLFLRNCGLGVRLGPYARKIILAIFYEAHNGFADNKTGTYLRLSRESFKTRLQLRFKSYFEHHKPPYFFHSSIIFRKSLNR
jgi:hypothetical protein